MQSIYCEIESDKTYTDNPDNLWAEHFDHYIVRTECNRTILYHNRQNNTIQIELPPPSSPETSIIDTVDVHNRRVPKKFRKTIRLKL